MSRHEPRQRLAEEFGATDLVAERGQEAVARVRELTDGVGADAVLEGVGTDEAMHQAIRSARAGGGVGFVGVPHGVTLTGRDLFGTMVRVHGGPAPGGRFPPPLTHPVYAGGGGPAPVRRFLPELIDLVYAGGIDPGRVFDLELPLEEVAEGYRAMDERRAIKAYPRP